MIERALFDTGPLFRYIVSDDPLNARVLTMVRRMTDEGCELCFAPQAVREGWSLLTRPRDVGGYGYSVLQAQEVVQSLRESFTFLEDVPEILVQWQLLVAKYAIVGKSVHDANVVATALAHGATHVLTLNERDFRRYSEVEVVAP